MDSLYKSHAERKYVAFRVECWLKNAKYVLSRLEQFSDARRELEVEFVWMQLQLGTRLALHWHDRR